MVWSNVKKTAMLCSTLLLGCATTQTVWVKPGATQNDFSMDHAQCSAQAFSVPNAPLMQVAIIQNQCLRGKGWYLEERPINR